MKIKGISIWEQQLERILLAVAALIFVGFALMQFIGEPNAQKVGKETYTPGDVDDRLTEQAERLLARLAPSAPSPVTITIPDTMHEMFAAKLESGVSPNQSLAVALHVAENLGGGATIGPALQPYVVPDVPAPHTLVHRQYFDALLADVVQAFPQLQPRAPEEPFDLTWVTPAAVFDLGRVNEQLRTPGPDGELAIPEKWYNGKLPILAVKVEREELVAGQWVNHTMLEPIPGQWSLEAVVEGTIDGLAAQSVLDVLSETAVQRDIVQPEFYATRNASWAPPDPNEKQIIIDEDDLMDEDAMRISNLQRRLAQIKARREAVWQALEDLGGPLEEMPEEERGGGGKRGGDDNGLMGGGSGGGIKDPTASSGDKAKLRQRVSLTRKVHVLDKQIADLEAELAELAQVEPVEEVAEEAPSLLDSDQLLVWAHDLDVEPGRTYRYRFTVEMFNPLFAREINLVDEQQQLAKDIRLASAPSEWSRPLRAEGMLRVFVTRATAPDDTGRLGGLSGTDLGSGTAEVYRFHDGRWWGETFRILPGDRVGKVMSLGPRGSSVEIDFRTDWFVLDVFRNLAVDASNLAVRDRAAKVVLQSLNSGEWIERDPLSEARDPERARLQADVELAELSGQEIASR